MRILSIAKWLVGLIMLLCIIGGALTLFGLIEANEFMPSSMDELTKTTVTVEKIDVEDSREIIITKEYPYDRLLPVKSNAIHLPLKKGDKIEIYIGKEDAPNLKLVKATMVWGINSANGKTILDPNVIIGTMQSPILRSILITNFAFIIIPCLYFFVMIVLFIRKRLAKRVK